MAGPDRKPRDPVALAAELERRPWEFDFFHALRLVEAAHPDRPRLGASVKPSDDPIRLGQEPSLAFAPSTIAWYRRGKDDRPDRMSVHLLGLLGPNGPLPLHLTEFVRDRQRHSADPTIARFLDIFHHRILSLFYRAWAAGRPSVNHDRPEADRFTVYAGAVAGLAMPSLRDRDLWPDRSKFFFAGRLGGGTRPPEALRSMIAGTFGLPVRVEEFTGEWLELSDDARCRLGTGVATGVLGGALVLGSRTWDCQHKFRVVFGPVRLADYERLLPGGDELQVLAALIKNFVGDEQTWDIRVFLDRRDVPEFRLGGEQRLGWTTWLAGGVRSEDPGDLLVSAAAVQ